ncbi:hypothetical protein ILUMI_03625 [Ignelater luminosus]|uniref:Uncharacterized protein n=1 Tax=Ignelater luminosus TaxID=2038154 RepID=A0A8K0GI54_IGNLU|nr:hypothetical protein ILUMI_03625 [Ignelater luminosus]
MESFKAIGGEQPSMHLITIVRERTKRQKTKKLREFTPASVLSYATQMGLRDEGQSQASRLLKEITNTSPTCASRYALAVLVDAKLSRHQYDVIRTSALEIFPSYKTVQAAEKLCYPKDPNVTETCVDVTLQALLDHIVERLLLTVKSMVQTLRNEELNKFCLITKWGFDGSSGHSLHKQAFHGPEAKDGGAIGIPDNETALLKWMTLPQHHENTKAFDDRYRRHVNQLIAVLNDHGNPFEEDILVSVDSRKIIPEEHTVQMMKEAYQIDVSNLSPTWHEEADGRLLLHVRHAAENGHKKYAFRCIRTVDSDVVAIAIGVNECRRYLYTKTNRTIKNKPPTKDALLQHSLRAQLQANIWLNCFDNTYVPPKPDNYGWKMGAVWEIFSTTALYFIELKNELNVSCLAME